jgi:hypothetical protein
MAIPRGESTILPNEGQVHQSNLASQSKRASVGTRLEYMSSKHSKKVVVADEDASIGGYGREACMRGRPCLK